MSGQTPELMVECEIARITLCRPAQHNRMEPRDIATMHAHIEAIAGDAAIRAVVLTGEGKSFCSGYDIASFAAAEGGVTPTSGHDFNGLCDALEALPQPVVCALNGPVYGGAIDLALACDFRLSHDGLVMAVPAARLGLHYYASGQRRYVSRLGLNAAKRLLLAAETLDAAHALRIGFLDEIVPVDLVLEKALVLAARLARNAPVATQDMKRSLNAIADGTADDVAMNALFSKSLASDDFAEGRAAWAEKRKPEFKGK